MDPRTEQKLRKNGAITDSNKLDLRNEIQAEYGQRRVPWFSWVFNLLDLPNGSRVLEMACGSGGMWVENRERISASWKIVSTDLSASIVQEARNKLSGEQSGFRFLGTDSQALPFPAESFDAILAVGLLDLVPRLDRALSEAWRVLRPSGQFIASAGGKGHLHELENLLKPYLPEEQAARLGGDENHFGLENGAARLAPFFEEVVRHDFNDRMVFTTLQPILDYVLSEQAVVWSMPMDKLGKFVQRIKRDLAHHDRIEVTVRKGIFVARKKVING